MMRRIPWVLVLGVVILGCTQEMSPRERMVQVQLVEDRVNTWARFLNNSEQDSLATLYHQGADLEYVWWGERSSGWEEVRLARHNFYNSIDYMNFVMQSPEVQLLSPTVALVTFRHSTDIFRRQRRQPVSSGYGTMVWRREGDRPEWRIVAEHISLNPPSAN